MQRSPNRLPALYRRATSSRANRHDSLGQALVELALILPLMLVLFGSALDLGRVYYSQITLDNAAKEGALEAARDTENLTEFDNTQPCDASTNRVVCLVVNEAKGSLISIDPSDIDLACDPDPCPAAPIIGDTVAVTVNSDFMLVSPILYVFFGGQTIPISATSIAQIGVDPAPGYVLTPTPPPTPTPTPTPTPEPTETTEPTEEPEPSPTPVCTTPVVSGSISINPGSGKSDNFSGGATNFTMTAPTPAAQPEGCEFTYSWSFGDAINGYGQTVTHQYADAGVGQGNYYTVTLVISTLYGPSWTGTTTVKVTP